MIVLEIVFWTAIILSLWTYVGYGVFLKIISIFMPARCFPDSYVPSISVIITAHNEEKNIAAKLENTLTAGYPKDKKQIVLISDGSTDNTVTIAEKILRPNIDLVFTQNRSGKHHGQGKGIEIASGEIIVLTDATTFLKEDALLKIVRAFADPKVGCVSGLDQPEFTDSSALGEGIYVKYEMKIREYESKINSLLGVSGSFFAIRKELCDQWRGDISSDFYLPIKSFMRGYISILDIEAIGYYKVIDDPAAEFRRKIRTVVHGLDVLAISKAALNPFRYGFFSFQLLSHKLLRWIVPFNMILVLVINVVLIKLGWLYYILGVLQLCFYLAIIISYLIKPAREIIVFRIPHFFYLANISILIAWFKYLGGERYHKWEATKR